MRAIFESRFMRVVLSDGSQMIDVELNTEFERFQHEVRNLSMWRPTIEEIREGFLLFLYVVYPQVS